VSVLILQSLLHTKSSPYNVPWRYRGKTEVQLCSLYSLHYGLGWVVSATPPTCYHPEMTQYPLYKRLGGPQGRSGRVRKVSRSPGFNPENRPARKKSLYWIRYPDTFHIWFKGSWSIMSEELGNTDCSLRYL